MVFCDKIISTISDWLRQNSSRLILKLLVHTSGANLMFFVRTQFQGAIVAVIVANQTSVIESLFSVKKSVQPVSYSCSSIRFKKKWTFFGIVSDDYSVLYRCKVSGFSRREFENDMNYRLFVVFGDLMEWIIFGAISSGFESGVVDNWLRPELVYFLHFVKPWW